MSNRVAMNVNVIAQRKANTPPDNISYHLEDDDGCLLETLVFSKDKLGMKKSDEHEVTFTLVQEEGMNLQFATPPDRAMWVNRGTAQNIPSCPTAQPPKNNTVFHATSSQGLTLVATNKNPQKCYYKFSLNFVDPTGQDPDYLYRFDPVGDNQNGGIGKNYASLVGVALAIGVLGVAYVAYTELFR